MVADLFIIAHSLFARTRFPHCKRLAKQKATVSGPTINAGWSEGRGGSWAASIATVDVPVAYPAEVDPDNGLLRSRRWNRPFNDPIRCSVRTRKNSRVYLQCWDRTHNRRGLWKASREIIFQPATERLSLRIQNTSIS
jgi:hypothetical protein